MRYLIIVIIIIFTLSGCGNNNATSQSFDLTATKAPEVEEPVSESGVPDIENDNAIIEGDEGQDRTILIGTWQDTPSIGSADGQRYHFFDDGSFIFEYSGYDQETRVLSEMGSWSFKNDKLTLITDRKVTIEGGEKSTEPLLPGDDNNEYVIVNGIIRIVDVDPAKKEEYVLKDFYFDEVDSPGRTTVMIGETRYWMYHDDPETYMNDPVKDGDIFRPWPPV